MLVSVVEQLLVVCDLEVEVAGEDPRHVGSLGRRQRGVSEPARLARGLQGRFQGGAQPGDGLVAVAVAEEHRGAPPRELRIEEPGERVVDHRAVGPRIHLVFRILQLLDPEQLAGEVRPGALGVRLQLGRAPEIAVAELLLEPRDEFGVGDPTVPGRERPPGPVEFDPGHVPCVLRRSRRRTDPDAGGHHARRRHEFFVERRHLAERLHEGTPHHLASGRVESRVRDRQRLLPRRREHPEELALPALPLGAQLEGNAVRRERGPLRFVEQRRAWCAHREAARLQAHQEEMAEVPVHPRETLDDRHAAPGRGPEGDLVVQQVRQLGVEPLGVEWGRGRAPSLLRLDPLRHQPGQPLPSLEVQPDHVEPVARHAPDPDLSFATDHRSGSGAARRAIP